MNFICKIWTLWRRENFISNLPSIPGLPHGTPGLIKWKWTSLSRVRLFVTPWTIQSMKFSRPEYCSGYSFPSPGDLPNPGIKPRSPALQVDSLPAEPQGNPRNLEWVAYPFSRGSSPPRNRTMVFCIAGRFFTNPAIIRAHNVLWTPSTPALLIDEKVVTTEVTVYPSEFVKLGCGCQARARIHAVSPLEMALG